MTVPLLDIINNISFEGWAVLVGSFFTAALSAVIFWQDTTNRSSKFFFLLGIANAFWGGAYALFEGSVGTPDASARATVLYAVAGVAPVFLFLFLYTFSVEKSLISFRKFIGLFAPYFILVGILMFYPGFIVGYREATEGVPGEIVFGKGFSIYMAYVLVFLGAGIFLLYKKYRESAGIFKSTLRELLIAICLSDILVIAVSLVAPIFCGCDIIFIGHLSTILLFFAAAFIIAKYHLWNIKIIATELFISIIILVLIAELFMASSFLDLIVKTGITALIIFSSSFLVGSVRREIQSKDRIAHLLFDLDIISKRLKVLDKKKSEFLSVASHHLRDPLTAIKGYASMLEEGSFGELPLSVREAVGKIFESSGRLITMISDFMDISRIESGDMNYVFADVDLKKMVVDLVGEMKQHADRSHLVLSVTLDEGLESNISFVAVGDAGKLRQVFSNLIDNSIKYTPQGEVSVLLSKSPDGKTILFSVSDTGIGMTDLTKEKIFRKFSRAEGVSKVYTEGTGLGLYVAKEIVNKHEGRIWAESKGEGQGSSFYVELEAKP